MTSLQLLIPASELKDSDETAWIQSVRLFFACYKVGYLAPIPNYEALPGFLGNRGNRAFISGEQRSNFEGNMGTKTILGNRDHKKTNFRFLGNRGTSQFISGEQGNWEGLNYTCMHILDSV